MCKGTCPKCEEELRYLEKELEKRKVIGRAVIIAGVAAGIYTSGIIVKEIQTEMKEFIEDMQGHGAVGPIDDEN